MGNQQGNPFKKKGDKGVKVSLREKHIERERGLEENGGIDYRVNGKEMQRGNRKVGNDRGNSDGMTMRMYGRRG
jgi:hypothetical protein